MFSPNTIHIPKRMAQHSKIHIFLGAPVIQDSLESSEELYPSELYPSRGSGEVWKETHCFYDNSVLCLPNGSTKCTKREGDSAHPSGVPVETKDEPIVTNITEHQSLPERLNTESCSHSNASQGTRSIVVSDIHLIKDISPLLLNSNVVSTDDGFRNTSKDGVYDITEKAAVHSNDISSLVSSTESICIEPVAMDHEPTCSPPHNHLHQSLSQYLDECFPSRQGATLSTDASFPDLSTETEFLSIVTASEVAVQAKRQFLEHNELKEMKAKEGAKEAEESSEEWETSFFQLSQTSETSTAASTVGHGTGDETGSSLDLFNPESAETFNSSDIFQISKGLYLPEKCSPKFLNKAAKEPQSDIHPMSPLSGGITPKRIRTKENVPGLPKKALESQQVTKKAKWFSSSISQDFNIDRNKSPVACEPSKRTMLLKDCSSKSQSYNILVAVVHPCHIKEVQCKSGPMTGSRVPLATIVVLDQSEVERKVVLWRAAAFWTLAVFPGDVILITDVTVCEDSWNRETILQSTTGSRLLNFGSCSALHPAECSHIVDVTSFLGLLAHLSSRHTYLTDLPPRKPQNLDCIQHVRYDQLQPDTLVHSLLKIVGITIITESLYLYKGQTQKKIILTVEQVKGKHGTLVLWGAGTLWLPQIQRKKEHIWEFRNLFARRNTFSGGIELHTTPWSSCECLFEDDRRALDFKAKYQNDEFAPPNIGDISSLLTEKYSGVVQVKAHISELKFSLDTLQIKDLILDSRTPLENIVASLPLITYSGCGKCGCELKTDENMVYQQCYRCLPFNKVHMFYRPALITAYDGECEIRVHVLPEMVEKIFLHIPPDLLNRSVVSSSDVTYGMVVADLCYSLLADPGDSYRLKLRSLFELDDNSMPLQQDFHLLDLIPDL
ncbi:hypothetical protein NDU88_010086 [Pleurodeles waltl]|uniref:Shieldin complex subunit 2 n=1 Tax=Pleurodeles waltl TaxID=8319 RepID=A0AAV7QWD0_PLEWA|nr:hypothetical protein NDU88_010086 [Pleurodeles waltl]